MKRRLWLKRTGVGALAGLLPPALARHIPTPSPTGLPAGTGAAPSIADIQWGLATRWPKSLDLLYGAAARFCQRVNCMTQGKFVITPFEAGANFPITGVRAAVAENMVESGHTSSVDDLDQHAALAFGASIPFGLTAQQQDAWLYYGGGLEDLNQIYHQLGVIGFPLGNTGNHLGGWFRREVNSLSDLQGLKMYMPGIAAEILKRVGVEPVSLEDKQIVDSLSQGVIDAAQWRGLHDEEQLGLAEAVNICYYPGWCMAGATQMLLINLPQWNQLPNDYQEVIQAAAIEINLETLALYNAANSQALQRLTAQGIKFKPYPADILKTLHQNSFEYYAELASQDTTFKQIYTSWSAFRNRIYAWNRLNEFSFTEFAVGAG